MAAGWLWHHTYCKINKDMKNAHRSSEKVVLKRCNLSEQTPLSLLSIINQDGKISDLCIFCPTKNLAGLRMRHAFDSSKATTDYD